MDAKRKSIARVCLLVLTGVALTGCRQETKVAATESRLETKKVRVARVQELAIEETVGAFGSLAAHDRAVLSAKVSGRVQAIFVDLGSPVKQGDLLAAIEKRDYELRREQAQAALAQARARLGLSLSGEEDEATPEKTSIVKEARAVLAEATKNRDRLLRLSKEGVIPEAEVETAEATFQVATNRFEESIHEAKNRMAALKQRQAELEMAEQQLKDTEIRAPFPGVVEQRQTSPGEFLNVGAPVITVVRVDPIRLRLEVAEKDGPRVKVGQKVYVRLEGNDEAHAATISRVSPVIAAGNRMLLVEADVPNAQRALRPGALVKADIVVNDKAPGIFVPSEAVQTFAGMQKIFLVQQGKAAEKQVKLGRKRGPLVEVLGGAKAGEMVVLQPGSLRSGQPVEIMANET
jgi:RND family efflux transporter MFP subunit